MATRVPLSDLASVELNSWVSFTIPHETKGQNNKRFRDQMKADANVLKADTISQLDNLRRDLLLALEKMKEENSAVNNSESVSEIPRTNALVTEAPSQSNSCHTLKFQEMLAKFGTMTISIPIQHRILRQLVFDSIYSREETIKEAETGTYEWILEETRSEGYIYHRIIKSPEEGSNDAKRVTLWCLGLERELTFSTYLAKLDLANLRS